MKHKQGSAGNMNLSLLPEQHLAAGTYDTQHHQRTPGEGCKPPSAVRRQVLVRWASRSDRLDRPQSYGLAANSASISLKT